MIKLLPKELEDVIFDYKEQMKIHIKKSRVLKQLGKEYKYEINESEFTSVQYKYKKYLYSYDKCIDGNKRFKIEYINPTFITGIDYRNKKTRHIVCFFHNGEYVEDFYECNRCLCLNCDGCDSDTE